MEILQEKMSQEREAARKKANSEVLRGPSGMEKAIQKEIDAHNRQKTPILPGGEGEWSQLADLILEAEIKDEIQTGILQEMAIRKAKGEGGNGLIQYVEPIRASLQALSMRVGASVDELLDVKASIDSELWLQKRWERAVRLEQIRTRLSSYEELTTIAVEKLKEGVTLGRIRETGELIAVANLGERMTLMAQAKNGPGQGNGHTANGEQTVNLQINNITSSSPNGDLPGPGSLGVINLTLSSRVHKQLTSQAPIDPEATEERFLNQIEMLSAKEIPELLEEREDENDAN